METYSIYIINLTAIIGFAVVVWIISLLLKDSSIADIGWGLGFVFIAWLTAWQTDFHSEYKTLLMVLITVWGVRLALHIGVRSHGKGEDTRYHAFRENWGGNYWWGSLFQVFLLQAVLCWIISLVVQAGMLSSESSTLSLVAWIGLFIWMMGFLFEVVADWQLMRFKSDPDNKGKVMDLGLWRYTRHPNYFGEAVMWWGIFLITFQNLNYLWTIISPLLITFLLLKVSGVSMLERNAVKTKPKYADYQRRTNAFIPWIPKK